MKVLINELYKANIEDELPGVNDNVLNFSPPDYAFGRCDGVIVKVEPVNNKEWIGRFAFGDFSLTGILPCPDDKTICIISKGLGYLVNANNPADWHLLPIEPVIGIYETNIENILIINNFTDLYAWGKNGLLWETKGLASDNVEIKKFDRSVVFGEATKYGQQICFEVDITTGKIKTKPLT